MTSVANYFLALCIFIILQGAGVIRADVFIEPWSGDMGRGSIFSYIRNCTLIVDRSYGACLSPMSASGSKLTIPLSYIGGITTVSVSDGVIIYIAYDGSEVPNAEYISRCDNTTWPEVHSKDKAGKSIASIVLQYMPEVDLNISEIMKEVEMCRQFH